MATGMEMMFAKMLGLTPEKLSKMSTSFVETVNSIDDRLKAIENKVNFIAAMYYEPEKDLKENDGSNHDKGGNA